MSRHPSWADLFGPVGNDDPWNTQADPTPPKTRRDLLTEVRDMSLQLAARKADELRTATAVDRGGSPHQVALNGAGEWIWASRDDNDWDTWVGGEPNT